jgi:hypothetical protein
MTTRLAISSTLLLLLMPCTGCDRVSSGSAQEPQLTSRELHAPTPITSKAWTHYEQAHSAYAARLVLRTWARPGLTYREWWADIEPLLSPAGRQDYAATDPAMIPALRVTGHARVGVPRIGTWRIVWIPTSAGECGVELSRHSTDSLWRASRIHFPEP